MSLHPNATFHINGASTKVLRYARHRKGPVTPEEVRAFFPHFFKRPYRAREAIQRLSRYDFMRQVDTDSWVITETGITFLYASAPTYRGENAN